MTVEMPVASAEPVEEPETETQPEPAIPIPITPSDIIASPDEEEDEDSDSDESASPVITEPVTAAEPQAHGPVRESAAPEGDRWAGTMSREWNDNDKPVEPITPEAKQKPKAPAKPKITVAQAAEMIPADALKYIRENFKTDIQHVRSYDPSNSVKTK